MTAAFGVGSRPVRMKQPVLENLLEPHRRIDRRHPQHLLTVVAQPVALASRDVDRVGGRDRHVTITDRAV